MINFNREGTLIGLKGVQSKKSGTYFIIATFAVYYNLDCDKREDIYNNIYEDVPKFHLGAYSMDYWITLDSPQKNDLVKELEIGAMYDLIVNGNYVNGFSRQLD